MSTATFDGLDINDPADRETYRLRVSSELMNVLSAKVLAEAKRIGGMGRTSTMQDAYAIIANDRIERERLKDFPYHLFDRNCSCGRSLNAARAEIMSGEYVMTCLCGFNHVRRMSKT